MRRRAPVVIGIAVVALCVCAIAILVRACGGAGMCNVENIAAGSILAVATAAVVFTAVVACSRAAHRLHQASCAIARLPATGPQTALREAMARTGVHRVVCLRDPERAAFTAGALRPRVHITSALVRELPPSELDAVLIHEQCHVLRRDPLRQALWTATIDTLFFLPVVAWFAHRRLASAEITADRAAVHLIGSRHVAGALLAVAGCGGDTRFASGLAVRAAALLGDLPVVIRPPIRDMLRSAGGAALAVGLLVCLSAVSGL